MKLWNEYEGETIAGVFPIVKLIRPEGRSAFFTTSNGSGKPAVLRLIESIHDETEILDRWNIVANLKQAHLITLKKFGQTVLDGTPLIYAVMEPTEADLSEILQDRPLTLEETRQIATSLVDALQALHASGLIHEHIEPATVLATNDGTQDIVKLRSDCIREAPEDAAEAEVARTRDVHDLAIVLLQALTQSRTLVANGHTLLPRPFDQIILNGVNGTWNLDQISTALTPPAAEPIKPPVASPAPATMPKYAAPTRKPQGKSSTPDQTPLPLFEHSPAAVAASIPPATPAAAPRTAPRASASAAIDRIKLSLQADPKSKRIWLASVAGAAIVIAALVWHSHATPDSPITPISDMGPAVATSSIAKPSDGTTKPIAPAKQNNPPAAQSPGQEPAQTLATPDGHAQWRVVAFTYNHEDQAWQKAASIGRQHSFLKPEVFSPTGRAPYLVTVGGAMTREQAFAFREKARRAGLPHDIYAQNYSNKTR
jgi:serine/threonine protein kinase